MVLTVTTYKLKCLNRHRSKSIRMTKLSFCQNESPLSKSLLQKDSLVTLILFVLCLFQPVANFRYHSLNVKTIRRMAQIFVAFSEKLKFTYQSKPKIGLILIFSARHFNSHTYNLVVGRGQQIVDIIFNSQIKTSMLEL